MENSYKYFKNKDCKYFPCHKTETEEFNCIFCFCPLFGVEECGGNYKILKNGWKDCSKCLIPHNPDNYDFIIKKLKEGV